MVLTTDTLLIFWWSGRRVVHYGPSRHSTASIRSMGSWCLRLFRWWTELVAWKSRGTAPVWNAEAVRVCRTYFAVSSGPGSIHVL